MLFNGSCTAIVTPFSKDGKQIDYVAFKNLIEMQIKAKTQAIVFLGTTGEAATISDKEKEQIIKFAVRTVAHRVPVIVGSGSNCTDTAVRKAKEYEKLGVDALLVVTPYYNKCTQNGLISHYTKIANSTSLPIVMYNVPSRTGVNMLPKTVAELSLVENIIGLKEASGSVEQIEETIRLVPNEFSVFCGDDGITLPALSVGAKGVISVISNIFPDMVQEMCDAFFECNYIKAQELQLKMLPLIKQLFCEPNPIPIKSAMQYMGLCNDAMRLPLSQIETENEECLIEQIDALTLDL